MIRKLGLTLLCAAGVWSSHVSANTIILGGGLKYPVDLPFNDPQTLYNPVSWIIKATCTVTHGAPVNKVRVVMKASTAKFNGEDLVVGKEITKDINTGDSFKIEAKGGAMVELTNDNESQEIIHAYCTAP